MKPIAPVVGVLVSCVTFACGGATVGDPGDPESSAVETRGDFVDPVSGQTCKGVAGTWRGLVYSEPHSGFYDFSLHIAQAAPEAPALSGSILARSWSGSTDDVTPPETCDTGFHWTVNETAEGKVGDDGTVAFGGTGWEVGEHLCGDRVTNYSLDKFEVFQSEGEGQTAKLSGVITDSAVWKDTGMHVELTRVSCP
jgi:hypothetical protein